MTAQDFRLEYGYHSTWLAQVLAVFNKTAMKRGPELADKVDRAFHHSQVVASLWQGDQLVAFGRMLTDFDLYSAIFDVVVDPAFQRRHLGCRIIAALTDKAPDSCVHLTATFGNEAFYHQQGFRYHKTAMARYPARLAHSPYLDHDRTPPCTR
ncbi:MAG: GNAT family N-acetyltransferase [Paludibacterium sp.]|uniref:GNAT family N-acetyltransferase n=1 Tax=Paludibacterium sp. TaxID=1917523 RepID=UPI0025E7AB0F|nr:GNAT family N-acetyltransferase [Paludibacterium sp.]MBV8048781.1 GNAT family N-acetyltransferase [Paludibacterium sp.]MBV8648834.1 GNAT family N-acetyltransferase [Paludibacterium sp.]